MDGLLFTVEAVSVKSAIQVIKYMGSKRAILDFIVPVVDSIADRGAECGAGAARVRRALRRRFLLVHGLLPVLAGVAAVHRAPGGGGQSLIPYPWS